jgi:hypothetical protein
VPHFYFLVSKFVINRKLINKISMIIPEIRHKLILAIEIKNDMKDAEISVTVTLNLIFFVRISKIFTPAHVREVILKTNKSTKIMI